MQCFQFWRTSLAESQEHWICAPPRLLALYHLMTSPRCVDLPKRFAPAPVPFACYGERTVLVSSVHLDSRRSTTGGDWPRKSPGSCFPAGLWSTRLLTKAGSRLATSRPSPGSGWLLVRIWLRFTPKMHQPLRSAEPWRPEWWISGLKSPEPGSPGIRVGHGTQPPWPHLLKQSLPAGTVRTASFRGRFRCLPSPTDRRDGGIPLMGVSLHRPPTRGLSVADPKGSAADRSCTRRLH